MAVYSCMCSGGFCGCPGNSKTENEVNTSYTLGSFSPSVSRQIQRLGSVVPLPIDMSSSLALGGPSELDIQDKRTKYFEWHELLPPSWEEKQDQIKLREIFNIEHLLALDFIQMKWGETSDMKLTINNWRMTPDFPTTIGTLSKSGLVDIDPTPGAKSTVHSAHEQGVAFDLRCQNENQNDKLWNWIAQYWVNFGIKRLLCKPDSKGENGLLSRVHIDFSTSGAEEGKLRIITASQKS